MDGISNKNQNGPSFADLLGRLRVNSPATQPNRDDVDTLHLTTARGATTQPQSQSLSIARPRAIGPTPQPGAQDLLDLAEDSATKANRQIERLDKNVEALSNDLAAVIHERVRGAIEAGQQFSTVGGQLIHDLQARSDVGTKLNNQMGAAIDRACDAILHGEPGVPADHLQRYVDEVSDPARRELAEYANQSTADATKMADALHEKETKAVGAFEASALAIVVTRKGISDLVESNLGILNTSAEAQFKRAMTAVDKAMEAQQKKFTQDLALRKEDRIDANATHRRNMDTRVQDRQDKVSDAAMALDKYKAEAEVALNELKEDHKEAKDLRDHKLNMTKEANRAHAERLRLVNERISNNNKKTVSIFNAIAKIFTPLGH